MKVSSPSHKGIEPVRDEKVEEREKKRRGQFRIFQGKPNNAPQFFPLKKEPGMLGYEKTRDS